MNLVQLVTIGELSPICAWRNQPQAQLVQDLRVQPEVANRQGARVWGAPGSVIFYSGMAPGHDVFFVTLRDVVHVNVRPRSSLDLVHPAGNAPGILVFEVLKFGTKIRSSEPGSEAKSSNTPKGCPVNSTAHGSPHLRLHGGYWRWSSGCFGIDNFKKTQLVQLGRVRGIFRRFPSRIVPLLPVVNRSIGTQVCQQDCILIATEAPVARLLNCGVLCTATTRNISAPGMR